MQFFLGGIWFFLDFFYLVFYPQVFLPKFDKSVPTGISLVFTAVIYNQSKCETKYSHKHLPTQCIDYFRGATLRKKIDIF